jgi:hypothetical protein
VIEGELTHALGVSDEFPRKLLERCVTSTRFRSSPATASQFATGSQSSAPRRTAAAGLTIALFLLLSATTITGFDATPYPFIIFTPLWCVEFALAGYVWKTIRVPAANLAIIAFFFWCVEIALLGTSPFPDPVAEERENALGISGEIIPYGRQTRAYHPLYGQGPRQGSRTRSRRLSPEGKVVFDVSYSYDEFGLRSIPPPSPNPSRAILFYGCSFTLGEGVSDSETFAFQTQQLLGGGHRTLNFGFHGYGPQQMLRSLETEAERLPLDGSRPTHLFYTTIPDHVRRAAGISPWDNGPRYEIAADGHIEYRGRFRGRSFYEILKRLIRSELLGRLFVTMTERPLEDGDFERFFAIVARSRDLFNQRYGGKFHVILWWDEPFRSRLAWRFENAGIDYILIQDILPDLQSANRSVGEYFIPGDSHPNARAHELIARYLARFVRASMDSEEAP